MWFRSIWFIAIALGIVLAAAPQILWVAGAIAGKIARFRVPYAPFGWASLALVLILWASLAYGNLVGRWQLRVTELTFESADVPAAFDGYRIAQVSDLHVDTYDDNPEALDRIVDRLLSLGTDVILFTGDMQTNDMDAVSRHADALKRLHAPDGVLSVLGNHDFFIHVPKYRTVDEKCAAADALERLENSLGWKVLRNANVILRRGADSLAIAGIDNINGNQGFRTIQKGDLPKALSGAEGMFTVLMSHDPSYWKSAVLPQSDVQITLSGHTHAAQMRFFGITPSKLVFDECDGRYDNGGRMLYVNAGLGCTNPFRIACPSEITVITLKTKR